MSWTTTRLDEKLVRCSPLESIYKTRLLQILSTIDMPFTNRYVPWSCVASWRCVACGKCCLEFRVPLRAREVVKITNIYGANAVELDASRLRAYLRKIGGKCVFQRQVHEFSLCLLQHVGMKPYACKMWPFAVKSEGVKGEEAAFMYDKRLFYIYLNPRCTGLRFGRPSVSLREKILPEAVELSLNPDRNHRYLTSTPPHILKKRLRMIQWSILSLERKRAMWGFSVST